METLILPKMPKVGYPEEYYASRIHRADLAHDSVLRESLKVGQYITLALNRNLDWPHKARYFEHAIHRHCAPPIDASEPVSEFFHRLRELVQAHAGEEAARIASQQDDVFAERLKTGEPRNEVRHDALAFFDALMGDAHRMPEWFHYDDWHQIMVMRGAWL